MYIGDCFFFFQAEDGIRDRSPSRGLGDVYKRQLFRLYSTIFTSKLIDLIPKNYALPMFFRNGSLHVKRFLLSTVLHQLDQKIIYPHYDFKHLTEKYFEIGMKLNDFSIQLVKY